MRPFLLPLISSFLLLLFACQTTQKPPWIEGFEKPAENPLLSADSTALFYCPVQQRAVQWQIADIFNPAAIVRNDSVFLFFRAEDDPTAGIGGRTSRIGLAVSTDGLAFAKYPQPVLFPDTSTHQKWDYPGGCEDPRVVATPAGKYIMTYTSWNKKTARLSVASSTDLFNWTKHGPAFETALNGQFVDTWSKSGSIITQEKEGQIVAVEINGKYWMYWGDVSIHLAYSDDLLGWTPVLDESGELLKVMNPRPKHFDSFLAEPGPPALLTDEGILLFYNGKNSEDEQTDPSLAKGTYCTGQALFDANDPAKLLDRQKKPFLCPDLPHEVTGQYQAGTTFVEALIRFKGKWWLYYGTADSMVGVAKQS